MTKADMVLNDYHIRLMKKHGVDAADRFLTPLEWYIRTGRASMDYIRRLADADPKKVIAILEKDGSVQDVLDRLKVLLYKLK